MQIMEGDVIATIKKHHKFISHYHTGGVPGRAEIDETQELIYPAIARAIAETAYHGFVGQEFIPRRDDKMASLLQGVEICTLEESASKSAIDPSHQYGQTAKPTARCALL